MKATVEREIKLAVDPGFSFPELPGEALAERLFASAYWDTAERALAGVGVTLRHRVEGDLGQWQLKIPHGLARLELEVAGDPLTIPAEFAALLAAFTRHGPLAPVATLATRRSGRRVDNGEGRPVAEAVVDDVSVFPESGESSHFAELEVELVGEGGEHDLRTIETALRVAGAHSGDDRPKLLRVLGVEQPASSRGDGTNAGRLRAAVADQRRTLLSRDPGTRLGTDPEDLHDMRVATRRIRSFLRTARPMLNGVWADRLRTELAWLADRLGAVRDLDVLLERLEPAIASLEPAERDALAAVLLPRLHAERGRAQARLLTSLGSARYFRLLDRLNQPLRPSPDLADAPPLSQIAADECRRLRKAMRAIDRDAPDEALHALRIKGKRARYAAELAQPLAGKRVAELIARTKAFQDVLGEHQDAFVAEECIRRYASRSRGAAAIGAGRLIERERYRRAKARRELPGAWKALEQAMRVAWK